MRNNHHEKTELELLEELKSYSIKLSEKLCDYIDKRIVDLKVHQEEDVQDQDLVAKQEQKSITDL